MNGASPNSTPPHTGNNFDFLRFLLAALVIFSHSFLLVGQGEREPLRLFTQQQTYLGEVAVEGFFAISGYLITASWLRSRSIGSYFWKRALRIYPGFFAVCLVCALVAGPLGAESAAAYFHGFPVLGFLRHALLLDKLELPATFVRHPVPDQVNGSLWTIKIEFECYLLVAGLGLAGVFRRRGAVLLGLGLMLLLGVLFLGPFALRRLPDSVETHLRFFSAFLVGMVFFLYRERIPWTLPLLGGSLLFLAAAAGLHWLEAVMVLPLGYVLMYAAFSRTPVLHGFGRRGDFSYGLYLYAWPVQQLLAPLFYPPHSGGVWAPYLLTAAAFPPALACAWASWHGIESPSLRLKPKTLLGASLQHSERVSPAPNSEGA